MSIERIMLDMCWSLAGLAICLVYRRISKWMWVPILSVGAALCISVQRFRYHTDLRGFNDINNGYPLYFSDIWYSVCWAFFFVGLAKVFADVRYRFDSFSREGPAAAPERPGDTAGPSIDSEREPDLEPKTQIQERRE